MHPTLAKLKKNDTLRALIGQDQSIRVVLAGKMWRHRQAESEGHYHDSDTASTPDDTLRHGDHEKWWHTRLEVIARALYNDVDGNALSKIVADWEEENPEPSTFQCVWEAVSTPAAVEAALSSMPPPDIPKNSLDGPLLEIISFDGKTFSSHPKPTVTPKTRARSQSDKTSRARKTSKAKSTAAPPPISPAHPLPSSSIPSSAEGDVDGETDDADPPVTQAATRVDVRPFPSSLPLLFRSNSCYRVLTQFPS